MPSIADILKPQILAAEKDFLFVYKPPRMHSAPLADSRGENILDWCARKHPEIRDFPGRKEGEGGLLHRLDFETHGLLLLARNRSGMEALLLQQTEGKIKKEYSALAAESKTVLSGFPGRKPGFPKVNPGSLAGKNITSAFRPYGPGRKAVRPVCIEASEGENEKDLYTTEIPEICPVSAGVFSLKLRICRGFRHQIRSHLAWLGMPILNDELYGGSSYGKGLLALRAFSITFNDPSSGEERRCSIPPLELGDV